jgi:hypothetical protein
VTIGPRLTRYVSRPDTFHDMLAVIETRDTHVLTKTDYFNIFLKPVRSTDFMAREITIEISGRMGGGAPD